MRFRRSDLPLESDAATRFLPWLIAFMVYLAALALAAALGVNDVLERWDRGLSGRMTVQVPPPEGDAQPEARQERLDAVLQVLRDTPGVERAEPLSERRMAALLEPWLDARGDIGELPLPQLVAVTVDPASPPDRAALAERLAAAAPGVRLDDHRRWLGQLTDLVRSLQVLAAVVVVLVAAAAVITVVFVTRTGLAIHRPVIEVLHLIGAYDAYVARQFQGHALKLGLLGGTIGLLLAAATVFVLERVFAGLAGPLLPGLALDAWQWAALVAVPLAAALVAMLTARFTVLRTLARLA